MSIRPCCHSAQWHGVSSCPTVRVYCFGGFEGDVLAVTAGRGHKVNLAWRLLFNFFAHSVVWNLE